MEKRVGTKKSLWWGPHPDEQDGGAAVNYYLLQAMNKTNPLHEFFGIPKVIDQLNPRELPFVQYYNIPPENIPDFMMQMDIPLMVMFHIPSSYFGIVNPLKYSGARLLVHQTIHWETDDIFKVDKDILGKIDCWVAPTKWAKNVLSTVGKIDQNKIIYIPHAVPLDKFYPHETLIRRTWSRDPNQKVILFMGRTSMFKGTTQIIPIMRSLINDYNCIFVIRAGPYSKQDMAIATVIDIMARKSTNNIWFYPDWLPSSMVEEIIAASDIVLLPSGHEGFNYPIIQSMACAKPVVTTYLPNHLEIMVRNNLCGLLLPPAQKVGTVNDGKQEIRVPAPDAIDGTLRFLLDNSDECKVMGQNGLKRVKRFYNLRSVATDWFNLMNDLAPSGYDMEKVSQKELLNL